jgi:hypothetical protein
MRNREGSVFSLLLGVVTLLAFVALPIGSVCVTRPCPDCGGADAGRSTFVRKPGYCRTPVAPIRCPRCGDRGRVSALRALRGSDLNPEIGELIRSEKDPYHRNVLVLLDRVVGRAGRDPAKVCGWTSPRTVANGWARFVRDGEKDYVLALFYPDARPGPVRAGVLLLDLKGRVLDYLAYEGEVDQSSVDARFPEGSPADGAVATVRVRSLPSAARHRFSVDLGGGMTLLSVTGQASEAGQRIGIAQDRLVILSPGLPQLR